MELLEGLKTRRSVRRYTDELISHELFEEIIDTAKMAPTWKNTQTLRYILIQNEEIIRKSVTIVCLDLSTTQRHCPSVKIWLC